MLEQVEWGEFRLWDLFKQYRWKEKAPNQCKDGNCPLINETSTNNWFTRNVIPTKIFKWNAITISINYASTVFYQRNDFCASVNISILKNDELLKNERIALYIVSLLRKENLKYNYAQKISKDKINDTIIRLPVKNWEIDFDFMDKFIAELEAEHQAELEAYLEVTGLKNYELSSDELKVLKDFEDGKMEWKEFKIEKVLDRMPQKEIDPLKIPNLRIEWECKYPFYGQSTLNNGVISYEYLKDSVLNNSNGFPTILIHSNNQNVVYLESPFYLKDWHWATSVLQKENLNKLNAMFIITVISKIIKQKFSYQTKATKIALKNTEIKLPVKDNQPDYDLMETFISAVHKLVIKDLVLYNQERLKATAQVINKNL